MARSQAARSCPVVRSAALGVIRFSTVAAPTGSRTARASAMTPARAWSRIPADSSARVCGARGRRAPGEIAARAKLVVGSAGSEDEHGADLLGDVLAGPTAGAGAASVKLVHGGQPQSGFTRLH